MGLRIKRFEIGTKDTLLEMPKSFQKLIFVNDTDYDIELRLEKEGKEFTIIFNNSHREFYFKDLIEIQRIFLRAETDIIISIEIYI